MDPSKVAPKKLSILHHALSQYIFAGFLVGHSSAHEVFTMDLHLRTNFKVITIKISFSQISSPCMIDGQTLEHFEHPKIALWPTKPHNFLVEGITQVQHIRAAQMKIYLLG